MGRRFVAAAAIVIFGLVLGTAAGAKDKDDKDKLVGAQEAIVDFGVPNTPTGNQANHFLVPNEVNVSKGGTVVFRVNGGGHGVSVYRVSENTTREDIEAGMCPVRDTCTPAFIAQDHVLIDGEGNIVAVSGTNPPFLRLDDASRVLFGTAAQIPGEDPGRFHQGTPVAATPTAAAQSSERIRVKFVKNGRYLVTCMNRNHSINDWMFGFVNVTGDDDKDK